MTKKIADVTFALTAEEAAVCTKYTAEGFTPTGRRRYPVLMPLSDGQIVELGEQAARIDADLRVLRQGKNATAAALNREKREREGAMHALSSRVLSKKDELGKALDLPERARYTRQLAVARKEYDEWEVERKATLDALKAELTEKEEEHGKLSANIADGRGHQQVSVVDLTDYKASTVVSVRADTGDEVGRRALEEFERQASLFDDLDKADSLTDKEYALCIAGRSAEAIELYAVRHPGMDKMKARVIVVGLIKADVDDELPPEAGGEE